MNSSKKVNLAVLFASLFALQACAHSPSVNRSIAQANSDLVSTDSGHITYTKAAYKISQDDLCAGIAVNAVFTAIGKKYFNSHQDDPSDFDLFSIQKIETVKSGKTYKVVASVNSDKNAFSYTVQVKCSGEVVKGLEQIGNE